MDPLRDFILYSLNQTSVESYTKAEPSHPVVINCMKQTKCEYDGMTSNGINVHVTFHYNQSNSSRV